MSDSSSSAADAGPAAGTGAATGGAGGALRVLLVDDDATFRRAMAKALGRKGLVVSELGGGAAAIRALSDENVEADVVVLDLQMPDVSGMQVLRSTPRRRALPRIIVLTGHGTVPDAVEAMRLGAYSFLLKPLDADELLPVLQQAVAADLKARDELIGDSQALRELRSVLDHCAQAADPVLLLGETGTGKEVAARYLHQRSRRASQPLVAINLACLPRELIESELFGHARGAFTGADRKRRGLFAEAGQGTLFLDEISELPLELQPKLLRALETRSFRPVGESREEPLQAALVCATNRDLRTLVRRGTFREDLFYRLAVLPVVLPPLRDHPEDIVPIAEHWLGKLAPAHLLATQTELRLTADARAALRSHDYPGNVRELVNVIRRVALFAHSDGRVDGALVQRMLAEDPFRTLRSRPPGRPVGSAGAAAPLAAQIAPSAAPQSPLSGAPAAAFSPSEDAAAEGKKQSSPLVSAQAPLIGSAPASSEPLSLRELEIRHIERLLREHKNITMVAKLLDIDRRTLQRKLRSLGIDWRDE
jgi:DNA-binding NtrC family response regulator